MLRCMNAVSSTQNEADRKQFFDYFRGRLATTSRTDIPLPDRLVLVTACLDALASHWHASAEGVPTDLSGSERMRVFLLRHGDHQAFNKVSAPMLRNATGNELGTSFPFARYKPNQMNEVADWNDDPDFAVLEGATDGKTLNRWSYGGILYKDFRCAWVHNFAPDNGHIRVTEPDNFDRVEPYYRYISNRDRYLLMVPFAFLVDTLSRVIASFEREVTTRDVLPFRT